MKNNCLIKKESFYCLDVGYSKYISKKGKHYNTMTIEFVPYRVQVNLVSIKYVETVKEEFSGWIEQKNISMIFIIKDYYFHLFLKIFFKIIFWIFFTLFFFQLKMCEIELKIKVQNKLPNLIQNNV